MPNQLLEVNNILYEWSCSSPVPGVCRANKESLTPSCFNGLQCDCKFYVKEYEPYSVYNDKTVLLVTTMRDIHVISNENDVVIHTQNRSYYFPWVNNISDIVLGNRRFRSPLEIYPSDVIEIPMRYWDKNNISFYTIQEDKLSLKVQQKLEDTIKQFLKKK